MGGRRDQQAALQAALQARVAGLLPAGRCQSPAPLETPRCPDRTQRMGGRMGGKSLEKSPYRHTSWGRGSLLQPLSLESPHLGKSAPSTAGRAWLAICQEDEREGGGRNEKQALRVWTAYATLISNQEEEFPKGSGWPCN